MDHRNDELLRLSECIESLKSEVKQKMRCGAARSGGTKVTSRGLSEKSLCERAMWSQMRHARTKNAAANWKSKLTAEGSIRCEGEIDDP